MGSSPADVRPTSAARRGRRVAIATVALLAFAACSGDGEESTPTPTPAPTTRPPVSDTTSPTTSVPVGTTNPSTTTAATTLSSTSTAPPTSPPGAVDLSTIVEPSNFGSIGYLVGPGVYRTDRLGVPIEVTIDERLEYINFPGHLSFAPTIATDRRPYGVFIHEMIGFVPAENMAMSREFGVVPDDIDSFTGSFDDWFTGEPRVKVIHTGEATVAGAPAPWWDIEVDSSAGETYSCGFGDCVTFIVDPSTGSTIIGDAWQFRIWHLTAFDHATIIALVEATEDQWEPTLAIADGILDSIVLVSDDRL